VPTYRRNYRNECIELRELLTAACKQLERYGIEMPGGWRTNEGRPKPFGVLAWWRYHKRLALLERQRRSDLGLIQKAIAIEEAKEEELNDAENYV